MAFSTGSLTSQSEGGSPRRAGAAFDLDAPALELCIGAELWGLGADGRRSVLSYLRLNLSEVCTYRVLWCTASVLTCSFQQPDLFLCPSILLLPRLPLSSASLLAHWACVSSGESLRHWRPRRHRALQIDALCAWLSLYLYLIPEPVRLPQSHIGSSLALLEVLCKPYFRHSTLRVPNSRIGGSGPTTLCFVECDVPEQQGLYPFLPFGFSPLGCSPRARLVLLRGAWNHLGLAAIPHRVPNNRIGGSGPMTGGDPSARRFVCIARAQKTGDK